MVEMRVDQSLSLHLLLVKEFIRSSKISLLEVILSCSVTEENMALQTMATICLQHILLELLELLLFLPPVS